MRHEAERTDGDKREADRAVSCGLARPFAIAEPRVAREEQVAAVGQGDDEAGP